MRAVLAARSQLKRAAGLSLASIVSLLGCGVADNDPRLWHHADLVKGAPGSGGAGGSGAGMSVGEGGGLASTAEATSSGSGGSSVNSGACSFNFTTTTADYYGQYSPRNVGAIWIDNAQGGFVRTLAAWGSKRIINVTHWVSNSGANEVDAITSATAYTDVAHPVSWDCLDIDGNAVPDGQYVLNEEFTSDNSASGFGTPTHFRQLTFEKGTTPLSLNPPDGTNFVAQQLSIH